ncbi:hypothetical protein [Sphingomonas sp. J315]|uniref:hypothetical protein n=1 Tax=Sphingomonas sp. J315 TaxID=2898433 RepID=UPI0021AE0E3D|nr:hypothetical protein [Sphingomonas sp. J315]UUY00552.1 hypothetical protein LRS08_05550 [Sphingomonas sp. J315]
MSLTIKALLDEFEAARSLQVIKLQIRPSPHSASFDTLFSDAIASAIAQTAYFDPLL